MYAAAYAACQCSTAEPRWVAFGSSSCTQASSAAGEDQRLFGSWSATAEAGKFAVSSPEEVACAVIARSGPPVGGTTCTWSTWRTVVWPATNTTGTWYVPDGVSGPAVTSSGTPTLPPRGTLTPVTGATVSPLATTGTSVRSSPVTPSGRPASTVTRACTGTASPVTASTEASARLSRAAGASAYQGITWLTTGGSPPGFQASRNASAGRPPAASSFQPGCTVPISVQVPSGCRTATAAEARTPGSVSTVSRSSGRAAPSSTVSGSSCAVGAVAAR